MGIVDHYQNGIGEVSRALDAALTDEAAIARNGRAAELMKSGVPERLALRLASLPALTVAPDIVLVADKTSRSVPDVARTFLAVVRYFRLERIANDAREIAAADYFDRLALDRARDSLARAARHLTAEVLKGGAGAEAMEAWVKPRANEVERIRTSMHEIADTGLTLSKLSVAASLLGDLAGR
jgi:glutamate dehydrogenase